MTKPMPVLTDEPTNLEYAIGEYNMAAQNLRFARDETYPPGSKVELQANQGPRIGIVVSDPQCPPDMVCAKIVGGTNPPLCYHLSKVNKHE